MSGRGRDRGSRGSDARLPPPRCGDRRLLAPGQPGRIRRGFPAHVCRDGAPPPPIRRSSATTPTAWAPGPAGRAAARPVRPAAAAHLDQRDHAAQLPSHAERARATPGLVPHPLVEPQPGHGIAAPAQVVDADPARPAAGPFEGPSNLGVAVEFGRASAAGDAGTAPTEHRRAGAPHRCPRIAAASACYRIWILLRAPRAARPNPVSEGDKEVAQHQGDPILRLADQERRRSTCDPERVGPHITNYGDKIRLPSVAITHSVRFGPPGPLSESPAAWLVIRARTSIVGATSAGLDGWHQRVLAADDSQGASARC
jgi:hypothetical protein